MIEMSKPVIRGVLIGLAVILLIVGVAALRSCGDDPAPQAEQTTASGDAIANAAQDAVSTITNRTDAERAIDAAAAEVKEELGNAAVPADLRARVAPFVCMRPEYSHDPACAVR